MKDFLNTRFGVEVEFTGISRRMAAKELAKVIGNDHITHLTSYDARIVKDAEGREWKIVSDSSIEVKKKSFDPYAMDSDEYKCEFVTPILHYEKDMETLQQVIRALRSAGGCVTSTCGIHIHVDGVQHDARSIKNFINLIAGHEDLLYDALEVGADRSRFCKKINSYFLYQITQKKPKSLSEIEDLWYNGAPERARQAHYNMTRYQFLNLHSFFHGHGTVELRGFNSTLHAGILRAYVVLALAMNYQALTSKSIRATVTAVQRDNPKFAMRTWMNRMGLIGDEFAACRKHLMKALKGNAAWRFGRAA